MNPQSIAFPSNVFGTSPSPVLVKWLGTAGFEICFEGHVVLVDPYLTRASLFRCATTALQSDVSAIAKYVSRADAIVLGHTHFDHALDVPAIAKKTGATVFGSPSAATLCRRMGVDESQIDVVEGYAVRETGPFELRFHPSVHSPLLLGNVPFPGEISDCGDVPLRAHHYRCGAVFGVEIRVAGKTIFHLGSAELVEASLPKLEVDLALMCVAGWRTSPRFPERAMRALSPRATLLAHWDNFLIPAERGAKLLPAMQMDRLVDRIDREARDVKIGTLAMMGTLIL